MVAAVSGLFCLEFGGKFRRWNLWRIFSGEFRRRFLPGFSAWVFGVGFLEWVFGRNTFRFEKSLSRIPVFIKLCKTPVSELSELAKAHQVRLCGLIKSSYFALQLFGLVGHIFSGEGLMTCSHVRKADAKRIQTPDLSARERLVVNFES